MLAKLSSFICAFPFKDQLLLRFFILLKLRFCHFEVDLLWDELFLLGACGR